MKKQMLIPQIRFSTFMMVTAALTVGALPLIPSSNAALPTASEMRTINQIAQLMQDQNPKQADSSTGQCFLEIMDEKQKVESSSASFPGSTEKRSTTSPACRDSQSPTQFR